MSCFLFLVSPSYGRVTAIYYHVGREKPHSLEDVLISVKPLHLACALGQAGWK